MSEQVGKWPNRPAATNLIAKVWYFTPWAMITSMWNPSAPLLLCTVSSDQPGVEPLFPFRTVHCGVMITRVWNPCPLLLCTVGSDHPCVEPLFHICTVHCRAMITQVWNPCSLFVLCNVGQLSPRRGAPVPLNYCAL